MLCAESGARLRIHKEYAMTKTVGDFLIDRLHAWGVRRIYGYPGDGINGVLGALNRAEGKIEFMPSLRVNSECAWRLRAPAPPIC
jgi:hypothetical protein